MDKCSPVLAMAFAATVILPWGAFAASPNPPAPVTLDPNDPQVQQQAHKLANEPPTPPPPGHRLVDDRSGRKQSGKASTYSDKFQGRKMANGKRFDHGGEAAASKTLPLGTVAKVTNLENGRTAEVTVEDRGPYVDGRTVDLTHKTAGQLGITQREGVAPVLVAPVSVPQQDGTVKAGAGALPGPATAK